MHWPNWRQISDIKEPNVTWKSQFDQFLKSEACPNFVKAAIERARRGEEPIREDDISILNNDDLDQPDWADIMGLQSEFEEEQFTYDDSGEDFNWSQTEFCLPPKCISWVQKLPEVANTEFETLDISDVNTEHMNKEQQFAFLLVMNTIKEYISESNTFRPLRMVVAGTAG